MKKLLYIITALLLLNACKKETTDPTSSTKSEEPKHITNYSMTITPRMKNSQGDTLTVTINSSVVLKKYQTGIGESYNYPTLKSGDHVSVFYSPGKVQNGSQSVVDENGLIIFVDHDNINGEVYNANCRCTTRFEHTFE